MHAERVCGEQTANIPAMLVTLDVSKFSGWLNADAPRFTPWLGLGYIGLGLGLELWFMVRFGGVRVRVRVIGFRIGLPKVKARREMLIAHGDQDTHRRACAEGTVLSAHRKHVVHHCDAGRVEAQRLVERLRFLRG